MNIKEMIDINFRGNVYIVQDDKILCESSTGYADLANEVPNSLETKFARACLKNAFHKMYVTLCGNDLSNTL